MARFEYKFLIATDRVPEIRRALLPFLETDENVNGSQDYAVHSIYFDTLSLDHYHQKEAGVYSRRKIRIRSYGKPDGDSTVFLEIKRKVDMSIAKNRAPVAYADLSALLSSGKVERYVMNGGRFPDAHDHAQQFLYNLHRFSLHPMALISYDREPYYRKFEPSLRITIDSNLRSAPHPSMKSLLQAAYMPSLPGYAILEVKFRRAVPYWLQSILADFKLQRLALSKYCLGLDALKLPPRSTRKATLSLTRSWATMFES